jgi:hypothetical protein
VRAAVPHVRRHLPPRVDDCQPRRTAAGQNPKNTDGEKERRKRSRRVGIPRTRRAGDGRKSLT